MFLELQIKLLTYLNRIGRSAWTKGNFLKVPTVPEIAPITFMDPIHESCSFVKGPVFNGVAFDISLSVAGEIHPEGRNFRILVGILTIFWNWLEFSPNHYFYINFINKPIIVPWLKKIKFAAKGYKELYIEWEKSIVK